MIVVVVWFCRSSSLAFLISSYLIILILMHHFLLHWVICLGGYLFVHLPVFFEKHLTFCVFLSVPHLVDNYAKIVDERVRNLMCDRTLPSRLVSYIMNSWFSEVILIKLSLRLSRVFDFSKAFGWLFLRLKQTIIVPTPLEGGGTIYSIGFFLFSHFWPIDIFIVESWDWYH